MVGEAVGARGASWGGPYLGSRTGDRVSGCEVGHVSFLPEIYLSSGREGLVHRFAAAWVRVRAAFDVWVVVCSARRSARLVRARFAPRVSLSIYLSIYQAARFRSIYLSILYNGG